MNNKFIIRLILNSPAFLSFNMNLLLRRPSFNLLAIALFVAIAGCGESSVTETDSNLTDASDSGAMAELEPDDASESQASEPDSTGAVPVDSNTTSEVASEIAESYPNIGVLTSAQSGDLKCYTTVRDPQGQVFDLGATFEICDRQASLLDQTVRLVYSEESVADCQSAEPCGRSRQETLISDAVILGDDWDTYSNGQWTVTVGRLGSWDGTNNTGNLTYYGCDRDGNCLSLADGFLVCRNGVCNMSWENGDYAYTLSSELTENGDGDTSLLVWQGETEILRAENMEVIDSSEY